MAARGRRQRPGRPTICRLLPTAAACSWAWDYAARFRLPQMATFGPLDRPNACIRSDPSESLLWEWDTSGRWGTGHCPAIGTPCSIEIDVEWLRPGGL